MMLDDGIKGREARVIFAYSDLLQQLSNPEGTLTIALGTQRRQQRNHCQRRISAFMLKGSMLEQQ